MAKIVKIEHFGVASQSNLAVGDDILFLNGREFKDILDYIYADSFEKIILRVKRGDTYFDCIIKKSSEETLGLCFEEKTELTPNNCSNNCIFCFVKQLPEGMRESLYVKDDDYRLSFSLGNYVTLTNVTNEDIERIIEYTLSPLYVSVHATNHNLRLKLLGIKKAHNILDILAKLTLNNIKIHAQIVLVPEVNDKEHLEKTLEDLLNLGENLQSVAVVPVGLTKFRKGLENIRVLNDKEAQSAIEIIERFYKKRKGFAFASDEMYQRANREMPNYDYYGMFDQIENGVGLIAKFLREIEFSLKSKRLRKKRNVGIITSVSGYPTIKKTCEIISAKWKNFRYDIYVIENEFFGKTITVTGLLTYTDIYNQLKSQPLDNDFLILSNVALRECSSLFLDNKSVSELSRALGKKIVLSGNDGECFIDTIIYGK